MAPNPSPSSSAIRITMDLPVVLPLASVLDKSPHPPHDSVASLLKLPGLHQDCALIPIIQTKCIMCKDCREADVELHQLLCLQAKQFSTTQDHDKDQDEDRVRVIILHTRTTRAEFAWASVTDAGLEINHPAIHEFRLSQKELVPVPDLVNHQLRNFVLSKWLGHGVLLWTLVNWAELPKQFLNKTAIFLGGKPGHSNLFYGPMVISVFKQDMVDLNMRTLDHVQMRTLRQVADYIQMVDDNPCIPNPVRFQSVPADLNPVPGLAPIPGVKINDKLELQLVAPFRITASKEEVSVAISPRRQEQWVAAVPFALGLKWYTRSAKLDMLIDEAQVADRVDENLAWFQWTLNSNHGASGSGQQIASVKYAQHYRSLVIVQAGGAPLGKEHIEALTMYLEQQQATYTDQDRAGISREGFQKYRNEHYANTRGDPPSPYELEIRFPENLVEEDADEMMALLAKNREIKNEGFRMTVIRIKMLLKRLLETCEENKRAVKVVEALISHCIGGKSIGDMRAKAVYEEIISKHDLEAVWDVDALTRTHSLPEVCQMARYLGRYKNEEYLSWF
ncbi:hypothetical protein N0V82_002431 [Gnomoniopsis sp. IMI 355080]|nr:hypothetical protein N0V82_002431 [Gnomoniopsis sp. IMI 355080]